MLKRIISQLFKATPIHPATAALEHDPSPVAQGAWSLADYFQAEIEKCPLIQECGREMVLRDFLHETKLKDGEPLTTEEKKALGINTRLKITSSHREALTLEGLRLGPKEVMNPLYYRATFDHNRHQQIAKMKSLGMLHYKPMACGDERDCEWCLSMNDKLIPVDVDFVQLIHDHCTCDYCRCVLNAPGPNF